MSRLDVLLSVATVTRAPRLATSGLGTTVLPWLPEEIAVSGMADAWSKLDRPGRTPVLRRTGLSLPETRVTFRLSDGGGSVAGIIAELGAHTRDVNPTTLILASVSRGSMHVTDLTVTEKDWDESGNPTDATVDIVLTQASDASVPIGPLPKPKPPKGKGKAKKGRRRK